MPRVLTFLLIGVTTATLSAPSVRLSVECTHSSLWGARGEKWDPSGRLPDFSYAGYQAGEATIPRKRPNWNLKRDFGAKGDGTADDSLALINAIRSIQNGVLFIPAGSYVITKRIDINKGEIVLRGAGPGQTILFFPKSLTDLFGNKAGSNGTSQWSFRPGLINVTGADLIGPETKLATVTRPAKRGDNALKLSNRLQLKKGEWVRLAQSDPQKPGSAAGTLIGHLYGDLMPPGEGLIGARNVVRFLTRVKSVSGQQIELERALPYDVRLEWTPEIHRFRPTLQEFGVESLSIHLPWTPYPGHFREPGYNALFFQNVANCWIDDVEVRNADFAVDMNSTNFCTVRKVTLTVSKDRAVADHARGLNGHHGIDVSHGTDNLVTQFDIQSRFAHDISVEWYALHTVFANGRGVDLNMDHHREANYSSLFSSIDCGACARPFNSGGSRNRGAHAGAYSTYWNVRSGVTEAASASPPGTAGFTLPSPDFGPLLNFIGIDLEGEVGNSPYQWLLEAPRSMICPAELHEAMRARRVGPKTRH